MEGATTALETAMSSISEAMSGAVGKAIPIALGIIGTVMVVTFGVKIFKKLTGKA